MENIPCPECGVRASIDFTHAGVGGSKPLRFTAHPLPAPITVKQGEVLRVIYDELGKPVHAEAIPDPDLIPRNAKKKKK